MNQVRIPPRPVEDWDEEVHDALSILRSRRSPGDAAEPPAVVAPRPASNVVGIFAWHPVLAKSWLGFSQHLSDSTLPDRVREMIIVRTSWIRRGEYEWVQHVRFARHVGLSDAEIDALSGRPDATVWDPMAAALVQTVDEICDTHYLSDATWNALSEFFDRTQLMDIVFTTCAYDLHATAFNIFGLQLDPGVQGFRG